MQPILKFPLSSTCASLMAIFVLLSLTNSCSGVIHQIKYEKKCNYQMVRAYGMVGRKTPSAARMEMCPGIKQSCCLKKDQLMMYNQWIKLKEIDFIRNRYDHNETEYIKFLNLLGRADSMIAEIAKKKLSHRKISNCKEMAKRISKFEVPMIIPKIKNNLRAMRDFMLIAFEGFYCSICDQKNHPHIDTSKKTVTYCEGFCRTLVEKTLANMLFLHVDVVKYVNLVSKFMVSCDFKGDYSSDALIPKHLIFFEQAEDKHKLNDCRDNRNKPEWLAYCSPVCQHFSMVNMDLFFEPNIEKIEIYIPWIEEEISQKKSEHLKHPMFMEKVKRGAAAKKFKPFPKLRKLSENITEGVDKNNNERQLSTPGVDPKHDIMDVQIFKSKMTSKVDLTGYMINFAEDGVCQYNAGKNSVISNDMYNEVKTLMHLENLTKDNRSLLDKAKGLFGLNTLSAQEKAEINELAQSSGPRFLAGAGKWASLMIMISSIAIVWLK